MNKVNYLIFFLVLTSSYGATQNNQFKIGFFGVDFMKSPNSCGGPLTTNVSYLGNNSSQMNILSLDGTNIVTNYTPEYWHNGTGFYNFLLLLKNNNLQVLTNTKDWWVPNANGIGGISVFNNNGNTNCSSGLARPNYDWHFNNLYNNIIFSSTIWGHQICEEASFINYHNSSTTACCSPVDTEIPPSEVSIAIQHFRNILQQNAINAPFVSDQKLIIMEGNHGKSITENLVYDQENIDPNSPITSKDIINIENKPDVFLEETYGYYGFDDGITNLYNNIFNNGDLLPSGQANNFHYLGRFKSIDYAKSKISSVHKVICVDNDAPEVVGKHFHSNQSIPNYNYIWFQVYNSIIHEVDGVWFYQIGSLYAPNERPAINDPTRFNESKFPAAYLDAIRFCTRELRYLVEKNLISTEENTKLLSKKDHEDIHCIIENYQKFLPSNFSPSQISELSNIGYSIRYTIRTNGNEVIFIATNPLPYPVKVDFNFNNISNNIVQNSTGLELLFENTTPNNLQIVSSSNYKVGTNRHSIIDYNIGPLNNFKQNLNYLNPYNKRVTVFFGPLDVHIFKFTGTTNTQYANGWDKNWSNNGNGNLGDWGKLISNTDKFIPLDFDEDGDEEILCIQNSNSNAWASIFDYDNQLQTWNSRPLWSNLGNGTISWWGIRALDKYIVSDFNGDGKKQELFISQGDGGYAIILKPNNNHTDFEVLWYNYGSNDLSYPNNSIWTISQNDKFIPFDQNGDGVANELLCINSSTGLNKIIKFSNSGFVVTNFGTNGILGNGQNTWNIGPIDQYINGDFNGDGIYNELICFERSIGQNATLLKYQNGQWSKPWANFGNGEIGGWGGPISPTDFILSGNLDTDSRTELMFIQNCGNCGWATTMDFRRSGFINYFSSNWSNHAYQGTQQDYISDWFVPSLNAIDNRYLLIKATSNSKYSLLAFRNLGCNNYLISMYSSSGSINKNLEGTSNNDFLINIWPNPTSDLINISSNSNIQFENWKIQLYNSEGQLCFEKKLSSENSSLDLQDYPKGLYYIQIFIGNEFISTKKIIKI